MLYNFDAADIFLAGKGVDYLDIPSHYILLRYSTYSNSLQIISLLSCQSSGFHDRPSADLSYVRSPEAKAECHLYQNYNLSRTHSIFRKIY